MNKTGVTGRAANRIVPFVVAVGLATALALGGCSFVPHAPGGPNSSGGGGSSADNQQHAALPATFPKSDVPLVGDDFAYTLAVSDSSWAVYVRVEDAKTGFAKASDLLVNAGFEKSTDIGGETDGGSLGVFLSDKYRIQLMSAKDSEWGPVVDYTVVATK